MIRFLLLALLASCSEEAPTPVVDAGATCSGERPTSRCYYCNGDVSTEKQCRDGAWQCPVGSVEKCEPKCTGDGPVCCPEAGDAGPTSAICTGRETWQCPLGTVPKAKCSSFF